MPRPCAKTHIPGSDGLWSNLNSVSLLRTSFGACKLGLIIAPSQKASLGSSKEPGALMLSKDVSAMSLLYSTFQFYRNMNF